MGCHYLGNRIEIKKLWFLEGWRPHNCGGYRVKVSGESMRGIKKFQHGSVNIDIRTFMVSLMYLYMN
jgi:hypothetical protein